MRSSLGGRYYLRPTQGTLHLSRAAHGCLHSHDKRMETQSTVDAISDVEPTTRGVASKRPGDPSFRSRCAVSFKCLSLDSQMSWDQGFRSTSRVSLGERIGFRKTHPHPQGGRNSPQRLSGHPRSERSYQSFYHTSVSPKTPPFGVRVSDPSRISAKKLVLTLLNCGLNKLYCHRNLDHCLNQECDTPTRSLKGASEDDTKKIRQ